MARGRYKFQSSDYPYFLTDTIVGWQPFFRDEAIVEILLDSLSHLQEKNRIILYAYVIMPDHVHYVARANNLSRETGALKSFTAWKIIEILQKRNDTLSLAILKSLKCSFKKDRAFQFWQEGSHPILIPSRKIMRQKIDYIHANPVKRGLVKNSIDWKYSSARNYAGLEGVLKVQTEW